jgi:Uma2 family endonuclease
MKNHKDSKDEILVVNEPEAMYGQTYTYADYVNFKFEEMVELIKGKIFKMSPAPRTTHQKISGNLFVCFATYLKHKQCQVFHAPFDVILPIGNKKNDNATTVVQPDIVVICNPEIIKEAGCFGVPNLLIEILSPSTAKKDLQDKYNVYEEAGVDEYWIVTPEIQCIEVFVLENNKYQRKGTYLKGDTVTPISLPELVIDLDEIFD